MYGVDLARIEFLAFFLYRLKVRIDPQFVILFRRKRAEYRKLEPETWKIWNEELSKVMKEQDMNWKWDITGEE